MANEDFIDEKVDLYLSYDYLMVEQYTRIIGAANEVYKSLAGSLIFGQLNYINSPLIVLYPIPLCLEEVFTGNSINTKLSFAKRFFPSISVNGETINVILPQWSAILVLSGLVLSYGMDKYKDYLDIRIKQLELNEKTRQEIKSQAEQLEKLSVTPHNSAVANVQQNVYLFQAQIYQSNIKQARINNQIIHEKP